MTKLAENIINKALASIDTTSITTEQLRQAIDAITAFNDGAMVFINNCELHSINETILQFNCTTSIIPINRITSVTTVR
jgi:hypothetical protein